MVLFLVSLRRVLARRQRCNTDLECLTFESVVIDVPSGERCDEVDDARNVRYGPRLGDDEFEPMQCFVPSHVTEDG